MEKVQISRGNMENGEKGYHMKGDLERYSLPEGRRGGKLGRFRKVSKND